MHGHIEPPARAPPAAFFGGGVLAGAVTGLGSRAGGPLSGGGPLGRAFLSTSLAGPPGREDFVGGEAAEVSGLSRLKVNSYLRNVGALAHG